ncbi:hypothetical protein JTB14_025638 [Gonioctena quinquepunctata]|nr:hypothetical protein JTB14_025638 [Gonioctena quinquepunctata]
MVRDRVVLGIRSKELQERLLHIDKLDLTKAIEMCRVNELTKAHLKEVQGQDAKIDVVLGRSRKPEKGNKPNENSKASKGGYICGRCGSKTPTKKLSSLRANKLVREVLEYQSHPSEDEEDFMVSTVVVNEIKNSNVWVESNGAQSTDDDKTVENPTSNIFDAATSSSKLSFEDLLLNTVKHTNNSLSVTKRKKVAAGAEVVTSKEVLDRLTVENRVKESKAKETQQRKEKRNAKGKSKRRKNALQLEESFSSSTLEEMVEYVDSEDDLDPEICC